MARSYTSFAAAMAALAAEEAAEAAKLEAERRAAATVAAKAAAKAEAEAEARRHQAQIALRFTAESKAYGPKFEAVGLRWAKMVWPILRAVEAGDLAAISALEGRITLGGKTEAARKAIIAREAARKALEVDGRGPMSDWAKAEAALAAKEALLAISMACGGLGRIAVIYNGKIVRWGC